MYLVPFAFYRGNGYFNSFVGRVRDSSSAGQTMTYVSFWGACNSVVGGWEDLGCKEEILYYCIYPECNFLLMISNFYVFHVCACICVCLCVFVCAPMHGFTVICELW